MPINAKAKAEVEKKKKQQGAISVKQPRVANTSPKKTSSGSTRSFMDVPLWRQTGPLKTVYNAPPVKKSPSSPYNFEVTPQNQWTAPHLAAYGRITGDSSVFDYLSAATDIDGAQFGNPYRAHRSTLPPAIQTQLREDLGYDGDFDRNFVNEYWPIYEQFLNTSDISYTATTPGKRATKEQRIAYNINKVAQYMDDQEELDRQYHQFATDLQNAANDFVQVRGYEPSLEDWNNLVDRSKYSRLSAIDKSLAIDGNVNRQNTTQILPLGTNYSPDIIPGLYYAWKNGEDITNDRDYFEDAVLYYMSPTANAPSTKQYPWSNTDLFSTTPEDRFGYSRNLAMKGQWEEAAAFKFALYEDEQRARGIEVKPTALEETIGFRKDAAWIEKAKERLGDDYYKYFVRDGIGETMPKPKESDSLQQRAAYEIYEAEQKLPLTEETEEAWKTFRDQAAAMYNNDFYESESDFKEDVYDQLISENDLIQDYLKPENYKKYGYELPISTEAIDAVISRIYNNPSHTASANVDYAALAQGKYDVQFMNDKQVSPPLFYSHNQQYQALTRATQRKVAEEHAAQAVESLSNSGVPVSKGELPVTSSSFTSEPSIQDRAEALLAGVWKAVRESKYVEKLGEGFSLKDAAAIDPVLNQLDYENAPESNEITVSDVEGLLTGNALAAANDEDITIATGIVKYAFPGSEHVADILHNVAMESPSSALEREQTFDVGVYRNVFNDRIEAGLSEYDAADIACFAATKLKNAVESLGMLYQDSEDLRKATNALISFISSEDGSKDTYEVIKAINDDVIRIVKGAFTEWENSSISYSNISSYSDDLNIRDEMSDLRVRNAAPAEEPAEEPTAAPDFTSRFGGAKKPHDASFISGALTEFNRNLLVGASGAASPAHKARTNALMHGIVSGEITPEDIVEGVTGEPLTYTAGGTQVTKEERAALVSELRGLARYDMAPIAGFESVMPSSQHLLDVIANGIDDPRGFMVTPSTRVFSSYDLDNMSDELKSALGVDRIREIAHSAATDPLYMSTYTLDESETAPFEEQIYTKLVNAAIDDFINPDALYHTDDRLEGEGSDFLGGIAALTSAYDAQKVPDKITGYIVEGRKRTGMQALAEDDPYNVAPALMASFGISESEEGQLVDLFRGYGNLFSRNEINAAFAAYNSGKATYRDIYNLALERIAHTDRHYYNGLQHQDDIVSSVGTMRDRYSELLIGNDARASEIAQELLDGSDVGAIIAKYPDIFGDADSQTLENIDYFRSLGGAEAKTRMIGLISPYIENMQSYTDEQLNVMGNVIDLVEQSGPSGFYLSYLSNDLLKELSGGKIDLTAAGFNGISEVMGLLDPDWQKPYNENVGTNLPAYGLVKGVGFGVKEILAIPANASHYFSEITGIETFGDKAYTALKDVDADVAAFEQNIAKSSEAFVARGVTEAVRNILTGKIGGLLTNMVASPALMMADPKTLSAAAHATRNVAQILGRLPFASSVFFREACEHLDAGEGKLVSTLKGAVSSAIELATEALPLEKAVSVKIRGVDLMDHVMNTMDGIKAYGSFFFLNTAKNIITEIGEEEAGLFGQRIVDYIDNRLTGSSPKEAYLAATKDFASEAAATALSTAFSTFLFGAYDLGGMTFNLMNDYMARGHGLDSNDSLSRAEAMDIIRTSLAEIFAAIDEDQDEYEDETLAENNRDEKATLADKKKAVRAYDATTQVPSFGSPNVTVEENAARQAGSEAVSEVGTEPMRDEQAVIGEKATESASNADVAQENEAQASSEVQEVAPEEAPKNADENQASSGNADVVEKPKKKSPRKRKKKPAPTDPVKKAEADIQSAAEEVRLNPSEETEKSYKDSLDNYDAAVAEQKAKAADVSTKAAADEQKVARKRARKTTKTAAEAQPEAQVEPQTDTAPQMSTPGAQAVADYMADSKAEVDEAIADKGADAVAEETVSSDPGIKAKQEAIEKAEQAINDLTDKAQELVEEGKHAQAQLEQAAAAAFDSAINPEIPSEQMTQVIFAKSQQRAGAEAEAAKLMDQADAKRKDVEADKEALDRETKDVKAEAKKKAKKKIKHDQEESKKAKAEQKQKEAEEAEKNPDTPEENDPEKRPWPKRKRLEYLPEDGPDAEQNKKINVARRKINDQIEMEDALTSNEIFGDDAEANPRTRQAITRNVGRSLLDTVKKYEQEELNARSAKRSGLDVISLYDNEGEKENVGAIRAEHEAKSKGFKESYEKTGDYTSEQLEGYVDPGNYKAQSDTQPQDEEAYKDVNIPEKEEREARADYNRRLLGDFGIKTLQNRPVTIIKIPKGQEALFDKVMALASVGDQTSVYRGRYGWTLSADAKAADTDNMRVSFDGGKTWVVPKEFRIPPKEENSEEENPGTEIVPKADNAEAGPPSTYGIFNDLENGFLSDYAAIVIEMADPDFSTRYYPPTRKGTTGPRLKVDTENNKYLVLTSVSGIWEEGAEAKKRRETFLAYTTNKIFGKTTPDGLSGLERLNQTVDHLNEVIENGNRMFAEAYAEQQKASDAYYADPTEANGIAFTQAKAKAIRLNNFIASKQQELAEATKALTEAEDFVAAYQAELNRKHSKKTGIPEGSITTSSSGSLANQNDLDSDKSHVVYYIIDKEKFNHEPAEVLQNVIDTVTSKLSSMEDASDEELVQLALRTDPAAQIPEGENERLDSVTNSLKDRYSAMTRGELLTAITKNATSIAIQSEYFKKAASGAVTVLKGGFKETSRQLNAILKKLGGFSPAGGPNSTAFANRGYFGHTLTRVITEEAAFKFLNEEERRSLGITKNTSQYKQDTKQAILEYAHDNNLSPEQIRYLLGETSPKTPGDIGNATIAHSDETHTLAVPKHMIDDPKANAPIRDPFKDRQIDTEMAKEVLGRKLEWIMESVSDPNYSLDTGVNSILVEINGMKRYVGQFYTDKSGKTYQWLPSLDEILENADKIVCNFPTQMKANNVNYRKETFVSFTLFPNTSSYEGVSEAKAALEHDENLDRQRNELAYTRGIKALKSEFKRLVDFYKKVTGVDYGDKDSNISLMMNPLSILHAKHNIAYERYKYWLEKATHCSQDQVDAVRQNVSKYKTMVSELSKAIVSAEDNLAGAVDAIRKLSGVEDRKAVSYGVAYEKLNELKSKRDALVARFDVVCKKPEKSQVDMSEIKSLEKRIDDYDEQINEIYKNNSIPRGNIGNVMKSETAARLDAMNAEESDEIALQNELRHATRIVRGESGENTASSDPRTWAERLQDAKNHLADIDELLFEHGDMWRENKRSNQIEPGNQTLQFMADMLRQIIPHLEKKAAIEAGATPEDLSPASKPKSKLLDDLKNRDYYNKMDIPKKIGLLTSLMEMGENVNEEYSNLVAQYHEDNLKGRTDEEKIKYWGAILKHIKTGKKSPFIDPSVDYQGYYDKLMEALNSAEKAETDSMNKRLGVIMKRAGTYKNKRTLNKIMNELASFKNAGIDVSEATKAIQGNIDALNNKTNLVAEATKDAAIQTVAGDDNALAEDMRVVTSATNEAAAAEITENIVPEDESQFTMNLQHFAAKPGENEESDIDESTESDTVLISDPIDPSLPGMNLNLLAPKPNASAEEEIPAGNPDDYTVPPEEDPYDAPARAAAEEMLEGMAADTNPDVPEATTGFENLVKAVKDNEGVKSGGMSINEAVSTLSEIAASINTIKDEIKDKEDKKSKIREEYDPLKESYDTMTAKTKNGEALTPEERAEYIELTKKYDAAKRKYDAITGDLKQLYKRRDDLKSQKKYLSTALSHNDIALSILNNRAAISPDVIEGTYETRASTHREIRNDMKKSARDFVDQLVKKFGNYYGRKTPYTPEQLYEAAKTILDESKLNENFVIASVINDGLKVRKQAIVLLDLGKAYINYKKGSMDSEEYKARVSKAISEILSLRTMKGFTEADIENQRKKREYSEKIVNDYIARINSEISGYSRSAQLDSYKSLLDDQLQILSNNISKVDKFVSDYFRVGSKDLLGVFTGENGGRAPISMIRIGVGMVMNAMQRNKNYIKPVTVTFSNIQRVVENYLGGSEASAFNAMYLDPLFQSNGLIENDRVNYNAGRPQIKSDEHRSIISHMLDKGLMTEDSLRNEYPDLSHEEASSLLDAANWYKRMFDTLLHVQNVVLTRNGKPPILKHKNYVSYIRAEKSGFLSALGINSNYDQLSAGLLGETADTTPAHPFNMFEKERKGKQIGSEMETDIDKIYDKYLDNALKTIHRTDGLVRLNDIISALGGYNVNVEGKKNQSEHYRGFLDYNDDLSLANGNLIQDANLSTFVRALKYYRDMMADKKIGKVDRALEEAGGRKVFGLARALVSLQSKAKIAGNMRPVMLNAVPLVTTFSMMPKSVAIALAQTLDKHTNDIRKDSNFAAARLADKKANNAVEKLVNILFLPMEKSDAFVTEVVWRAAYHNALEKFGDKEQARLGADKFCLSVMGDKATGNKGKFFATTTGSILGQFALEGTNEIDFLLHDFMRYLGKDSKSGNNLGFAGSVKALTAILLMAWGYYGLNEIIGANAVVDPIGSARKAIGTAKARNKDASFPEIARDASEQFLTNLAQTLNPIEDLTSGQILNAPLFSAVKNTGSSLADAGVGIYNSLFGGPKYAGDYSWTGDLVDAIFEWLPAGTEANRIRRAIQYANQGYVENAAGTNIKYGFDKDVVDIGLSSLFGVGASKGGRDYSYGRVSQFDKKTTDTIKNAISLGVDPSLAIENAYGNQTSRDLEAQASEAKRWGDRSEAKQYDSEAKSAREQNAYPSDASDELISNLQTDWGKKSVQMWQESGLKTYPDKPSSFIYKDEYKGKPVTYLKIDGKNYAISPDKEQSLVERYNRLAKQVILLYDDPKVVASELAKLPGKLKKYAVGGE